MYKQFLKSACIIFTIAFMVNSCDDDFFTSKSLEGTWSVYETSTTFGEQNFAVGIGYMPGDSTKITIDNFSNLGLGVEVSANLNDLFITIPSQTVSDPSSNQFTVSGNGTISSNYRRISMSYSYDGTNFSATMQKQF
jgi:hypothetical protein